LEPRLSAESAGSHSALYRSGKIHEVCICGRAAITSVSLPSRQVQQLDDCKPDTACSSASLSLPSTWPALGAVRSRRAVS